MRRLGTTKTIKRLLICIVVGLITSVGVAWVAAASIDVSSYWRAQAKYATPKIGSSWVYSQAQGRLYVGIVSWITLGDQSTEMVVQGPRWSRIRQLPTGYEFLPSGAMLEEAWGWPMLCLFSEVRRSRNPNLEEIISGLPIGSRTSSKEGPKILPIKPIWIGLLVNTSLYATITWLVLLGRVLVRNSIRRKRGQCIHCRYNVRELLVCPECGSEVVSR